MYAKALSVLAFYGFIRYDAKRGTAKPDCRI